MVYHLHHQLSQIGYHTFVLRLQERASLAVAEHMHFGTGSQLVLLVRRAFLLGSFCCYKYTKVNLTGTYYTELLPINLVH